MSDAKKPGSADRLGFSPDAVDAARHALRTGRGMAQFSHPELGGMGQWSPGMIMIGEMFNTGLKGRVDALFHALAAEVERDPPPAGIAGHDAWWPAELGAPASAGAQNDLRYAVFPERQRLAVWRDGSVTLYDTGNRRISGVGQQQGGSGSFSLSGPDGPVPLESLSPVKGGGDTGGPSPGGGVEREQEERRRPGGDEPGGDPIAAIERLAALHRDGILTEAEFTQKKTQLLARVR